MMKVIFTLILHHKVSVFSVCVCVFAWTNVGSGPAGAGEPTLGL